MAPISALRYRFFVRRSSSQKELHTGRGAMKLSQQKSFFLSKITLLQFM